MHTRRSVRTSPLAYDPEIERSARLRRKAVRQFSTNLDFAGLKELFTEMSDDEATRAESPPRGVDSYYRPGNFEDPSPTVYPAAANGVVSNFKIQPNLIAILPVFRGHEEPYEHLREFFSIADTYQVNNTTKDGLAKEVHKREAGKLPIYPDLNPKHKPGGPEHVNMVTSLRNGKTYNNDIKIPSAHDFSHDVEDFVTDEEIIVEGKKFDNVKSDLELVNDLLKDFPKTPTQNSKATESPKVEEGGVSSTTTPYPAALEKSASARFAKRVLIPRICGRLSSKKLKATLPKKIDLTEHVSAVLSSSLSPKFKDPGAPLISVVVGNIAIKKAILDLGASINILPASLVDKYDLGTLRKTDTIISLADRSTKILRGILEDVDVIDEEVQNHAPHTLKDDPLELYLTDENEEILDIAELQEIQECLVNSLDHQRPPWSYKVEPLPSNFDTATKPSLEVPPTLELKPLPSNLKYAFLGHNNTLPIIVASDLSGSQEEAILKVLSKYKAAVGWKIADLKRISPSLCMHRIVTDPDVKPSRDAQSRLNPNMKEVVKKEVLKWLDAVEKLSSQKFYCFLDGYSGYNQIPIHPDDQAKTTFTCPYETFPFRRMPFGLCNAPATFQRCMMSIFLDMVRESVEIFMDDFSIFGQSFESCLGQLERFEVDRAKVQIISTLPPPTNIKAVRSFLGYAGFYMRFIKDFSAISKPLCNLLLKEARFDFNESCLKSFNMLKQKLVEAPILQSPDWSKPFEIMCDASDYAAGAVLGQRVDKKPVVIFYASKTFSEAQMNYTTTEKELLAMVFALDKFRSYIWGHSKDKKGSKNVVADHLSRIIPPPFNPSDVIKESFPDESLFEVSKLPWYANIVNYLVVKKLPDYWSKQQRQYFFSQLKYYFWEDPELYKLCTDQVIRRCVLDHEHTYILAHYHSYAYGGHFGEMKTGHKVLVKDLLSKGPPQVVSEPFGELLLKKNSSLHVHTHTLFSFHGFSKSSDVERVLDVVKIFGMNSNENEENRASGGDVFDLIGDVDPTDEDEDIGIDDSTGVSASLVGEIFSRGKKCRESNIGDSDNTED
nr:DNA-directed DNA polymerase [Tanacetum cinerariifolium]